MDFTRFDRAGELAAIGLLLVAGVLVGALAGLSAIYQAYAHGLIGL